MENAPFYITLSAIILFLTAAQVIPAYGNWKEEIEKNKAVEETKRVVRAVQSVSTLGDVGSTEQLKIYIPDSYVIGVGNHSINLSKRGQLVKKYPLNSLELKYHGEYMLEGPAIINLTVTHWINGVNFTGKKDYLIEVIP